MGSGPLRQAVAIAGLMALIPTMASVALGRLTPEVGAVRALATLVGAIVFGRVCAVVMRYYAHVVERARPDGRERRARRGTDQ